MQVDEPERDEAEAIAPVVESDFASQELEVELVGVELAGDDAERATCPGEAREDGGLDERTAHFK